MSSLVLAGGGHSHALLLRRWAMQPHQRPPGLITLVSRSSTALYSGMVPGLIAGLYELESVAIDLRALADQAGVALVVAEITGLDPVARRLQLKQRPDLSYEWLSLNLGAITRQAAGAESALMPIKPLEPALAYLGAQDRHTLDASAADAPFRVVGSGLAAVETVLALRQRWPH
ncbi:bifunctional NADH dehydrogenase FAD-containing subunit/selenide, water dikinase SelD, partial [Pseudomonas sp. HMWF031]